ncbi:hypothetical protein [Xylophilus sp. GOD-11R]|uniref:hypothetical protein n=1 Tax=Xylophilus sp. GOD-11R TaxID=3089814 RepID=UPI00298CFE6B|nr:hypothetical protein [Xylophilus sp. GOD-11R]WPB58724.1 hypothetical protein R9X41_08825 [Xylophilus sp. GOD-11R]
MLVIRSETSKKHWNYFLALEDDLDLLARYIEFDERNLAVFSVELAHLLMAAASEVDVLAKLICTQVDPAAEAGNIGHYREILMPELSSLSNESVRIPRYGMSFTPWSAWGDAPPKSPGWWKGYNAVKHERGNCFELASLQNVLNAMGALLILNFHYYSRHLASDGRVLGKVETTNKLEPQSKLIRLDESSYSYPLMFG